jgi:Protein of unknown function (DUF559)
MDLSFPFRGSAALQRGLLTRAALYGPGFRRLYPDVYVSVSTSIDFTVQSLAAHELVAPCGILAGYSAAELLGAPCAPPRAPAEVILLDGYRRRPCDGLAVHRDAVATADIAVVERPDPSRPRRPARPGEHVEHPIWVTTPECTAAHLARWAPSLTEAVVAVDALCHRYGLDPATVVCARPGARMATRLPRAIELAEPLAESPMETRIRLAIVLAGLPLPVSQCPAGIPGRSFRLDLAYPELKLAFEYNGEEHLTPERAAADLVREQLLVAAGWTIIRFRALTVLHHPAQIAAQVAFERRLRGAA